VRQPPNEASIVGFWPSASTASRIDRASPTEFRQPTDTRAVLET